MTNKDLSQAFATLTTPQLVDACVRLQTLVRVAPSGIRSLAEGQRAAGLARPVRHYGSVDVFLEALVDALPGDVLVIDNGGRLDEGCIGDLIALECHAAGLAAIVVWGAHRDTAEIQQIGIPVFSYGTCPVGPLLVDTQEADALESARFGNYPVTRNDAVFADLDGVAFIPAVRSWLRTATRLDPKAVWQALEDGAKDTLSSGAGGRSSPRRSPPPSASSPWPEGFTGGS